MDPTSKNKNTARISMSPPNTQVTSGEAPFSPAISTLISNTFQHFIRVKRISASGSEIFSYCLKILQQRSHYIHYRFLYYNLVFNQL